MKITVTEKQAMHLNKLRSGQEALKSCMSMCRRIDTFKDTWKPEAIIQEKQKHKTIALDMYKQNMREVITELEANVRREPNFKEQNENERLYSMMMFKEILSVGKIADIVTAVKENLNNEVYMTLYQLHKQELIDKVTGEERLMLAELEAELENLSTDSEVSELLGTLKAMSGRVWQIEATGEAEYKAEICDINAL